MCAPPLAAAASALDGIAVLTLGGFVGYVLGAVVFVLLARALKFDFMARMSPAAITCAPCLAFCAFCVFAYAYVGALTMFFVWVDGVVSNEL